MESHEKFVSKYHESGNATTPPRWILMSSQNRICIFMETTMEARDSDQARKPHLFQITRRACRRDAQIERHDPGGTGARHRSVAAGSIRVRARRASRVGAHPCQDREGVCGFGRGHGRPFPARAHSKGTHVASGDAPRGATASADQNSTALRHSHHRRARDKQLTLAAGACGGEAA